MSKNNLKNFRGKVYISECPFDCTPTFYTGFAGRGDGKKAKLDPYIVFLPKLGIVCDNKEHGTLIKQDFYFDLEKINKPGIDFTKIFSEHEYHVRKMCREETEKMRTYLEESKKFTRDRL